MEAGNHDTSRSAEKFVRNLKKSTRGKAGITMEHDKNLIRRFTDNSKIKSRKKKNPGIPITTPLSKHT